VRVIEVEVRVDHVAHRLGREALHFLEEHPGGGGRHVVVDDHHFVVVDDHGAVADDSERAGAHRVIHALGHLVEAERVALMAGAGRRPRLRVGTIARLPPRRTEHERAYYEGQGQSFHGRDYFSKRVGAGLKTRNYVRERAKDPQLRTGAG
jgi:hypothetical protein